MKSGRARPNRAWVVSGIVATAVAVVAIVGVGGPAPAQVEPQEPSVDYVDAFGPGIYGYEDCDGVVHTEEDPYGAIYVELSEEVEADLPIALSFEGDLRDHMLEEPTELVVPAGEFWGQVTFELDAIQTGELTVTVEPGAGYVADPIEDTYTIEVTDQVFEVASCEDDLGTPPDGTDRQTIDIGERPDPIGFFDEDDLDDDSGDGGGGDGGTTTEGIDTTSSTSTTSTSIPPVDDVSAGFDRIRSLRATPPGFDTPIANGTLPPGLTYVDDEWSGAATTAGTYDFDVRLCFDQSSFLVDRGRAGGAQRPAPRAFPAVICYGYVDVEIVVRAAASTPAAAPPASPISTDAQFAG